jgi:hypothetical protein
LSITIDNQAPLCPHSLLFQRVLKTADSVLDIALNLVGLALTFQLGITCRLADGFLIEPLIFFAAPAIRSLSMTTYFYLGRQSLLQSDRQGIPFRSEILISARVARLIDPDQFTGNTSTSDPAQMAAPSRGEALVACY